MALDIYEVDLPLVLPGGREIYAVLEGDITDPGSPADPRACDPGSGPEWDWPECVTVQWCDGAPWMLTTLQALEQYAPGVWDEAQDAIAEALA